MGEKKWYKGKWQVSKEVAPLFIQYLNKIIQRGLEIVKEGEIWELLSYHPLKQWEEEKKSIESYAIVLQALFPDATIDCEWELISEKSWKICWQTYFKPQRITDDLIIIPKGWTYKPKIGEIAITIKPGMAFGTGMHETTKLCLKAMSVFYEKESPKSLLDVGTGTGILAIFGEKLGIEHILAIDIDPLAIEEAKENLSLNHVKKIKLLHSSLEGINGLFDWVVANLEVKTILPLKNKLKNIYRKSLILSGVLKSEVDDIKRTIGLPCRRIMNEGEWTCLIF